MMLLSKYHFARIVDKEYLPHWLHVISNGYLEQPAEQDWLLMSVTGKGLGTPMRARRVLTIPILTAHKCSIYEG